MVPARPLAGLSRLEHSGRCIRDGYRPRGQRPGRRRGAVRAPCCSRERPCTPAETMMVRAAPDRFLVRVILSGITRRGTTVSPIAVILGTGDFGPRERLPGRVEIGCVVKRAQWWRRCTR